MKNGSGSVAAHILSGTSRLDQNKKRSAAQEVRGRDQPGRLDITLGEGVSGLRLGWRNWAWTDVADLGDERGRRTRRLQLWLRHQYLEQ